MKEKETSIQTESKRLGRKPIDDKKIAVTIYRKKSDLEQLGGMIKVREIINQFIESKIKS